MVNEPYRKIQESRLYEDVAGQIRQRILTGALCPGSRLPALHAIAQEFGVSRTVVREAIQRLQSSGLVSVKHGSGAFVTEPTVATVSEMLQPVLRFRSASAYDLHEVREMLETSIASLAAQRATEEDKAELLRAIELMEASLGEPSEYIKTDLLFHAVLAKSTRNEVFLLLLQPLVELLLESRTRAANGPAALAESLCGHRAIFESVSRGDAAQAMRAMTDHLNETRRRLKAEEAAGQA